MDWPIIKAFLEDNNFPKYKSQQIFQAYFKNLIVDWNNMTNISKNDRLLLDDQFHLTSLTIKEVLNGKDTIKFLMETKDYNKKIETVLLKHKDGRNTLCVSSQIGCAMRCSFCATGTMGFHRNLTSEQIYDQVILVANHLKKDDQKITNIVFMGMGEPMLNFEDVKSAIIMLHKSNGFNLGWRHFTISTCGIIPGILSQIKELPQVNLAISLHAPNNDLRSQLMPVNKKYPIQDLMTACDTFVKETRRRIFFEYIMLKDINDKDEHAQELSRIIKKNPLYHVNLIRYHNTGFIDPHTGSEFQSSNNQSINNFIKILERNRVSVSLRHSFGTEIKAACGQLVTSNERIQE
jgi:23S rRNA (adenine2503-C2)-methyltransferase